LVLLVAEVLLVLVLLLLVVVLRRLLVLVRLLVGRLRELRRVLRELVRRLVRRLVRLRLRRRRRGGRDGGRGRRRPQVVVRRGRRVRLEQVQAVLAAPLLARKVQPRRLQVGGGGALPRGDEREWDR
jgi:hypothetical protein